MILTDLAIKNLVNHQKGALEYALLAVSGLKSSADIATYSSKIGRLHYSFRGHIKEKTDAKLSGFERAYMAHEFLWSGNPERYNSNVTLDKVVNAELAKEQVGNCVGLTSLYAVMLEREGIRSEIVVTHNHVLSRLRSKKRTVDIENTSKCGFASVHHIDKPSIPSYCLVAAVLNDQAKELKGSTKNKQALEYFDLALKIWPEYVNALVSRAMIYLNLDDVHSAEKDYTTLISVQPHDAVNHYNRAVLRMNRGNYKSAIPDLRNALILLPECSKYHSTKAEAEFKCNNFRQAVEDADRALRLDKGNKDAYWVRSNARQRLGDSKGAIVDNRMYQAMGG